MADASEWAAMVEKKKRHKYNVGAKENRTYDGVVYHCMAEAIYAQDLDILLNSGNIRHWERQVEFKLGEDDKTIVDFVVTEWHDKYVVEVKGVETPDFKRVKRLWKKYGPMDMQVLKRRGNRWDVCVIHGAQRGSK